MENQFQVVVREHPKALILDMRGDLSRNAHEPLLPLRSWDAKQDERSFIIFNFTQVPYINSLGIAILIRLVRASAKAGYQTFAYGVTAHYQKLFLMVGLAEHMMIYPDEYSILERIESLYST